MLAPSGRYVAATVPGGPKKRQCLAILDLQDSSKSKIIAGFDDVDIRWVRWVNDDRLVFSITDRQSPHENQLGQGLFAIDREGKVAARSLIKRKWLFEQETGTHIVDRELSVFHRFYSTVRDGSNDVIVQQSVYDNLDEPDHTVLLRLDTTTGRTRILTQDAPEHVYGWALDWKGEPRVAVAQVGDKERLYWKTSSDAPWKLVREIPVYGSAEPDIDPLWVGADDVLYLATPASPGGDFQSLKWLDLRKPDAQPQTLMSVEGYDFDGSLEFGPKGMLLGIHYSHDATRSHWFDPGLKAIQQQVDKLLPGTSNLLDCGLCANPSMVLVTSWSDQQPAIYRIFDVKAGTLSVLARSRPWIKPQAMALRDVVRIPARDGLSLPVHVTRPPGVKDAAPMVVLVHGGPYVRGGYWAWDEDSQFLASRGYVVIEPEFRGSTGYGRKHFRAGWKQWGLAMQDDIADATRWAIKQGYADPKRVCIAGASYGGYATLMGLIRYPDLYRCGVNWVGVTDIDLMYSITWSDSSEIFKRYGMPALVGDRKKDARQFEETSPLKQAAKLTQPLFMAYGGDDRRVPIDHGYKLRDAIGKNNPNLEWVAYMDEGHGWMLEANDIDFWSRVERFLDKHLKNAPQ